MANVTQDQVFQKPFVFVDVADATKALAGATTFQVCPVAPDTRDFVFVVGVIDSTGVQKTGFKATYSKTTGILTVENAGAFVLASGDVVTVAGNFGVVA